MNAATLNRLQRRYDGRAPIFRFPAVRYTTLPEDIRNNAGAIPASGDGAKLSEDKSGNSGVNVLVHNASGTGNSATMPALAALGTGNFTVAGIVSFDATSAGADQLMVGIPNAAAGFVLSVKVSTSRIAAGKNGTGYTSATNGTNLSALTDFYFAYTRSGTTGTYYINGVADGTCTDNFDYTATGVVALLQGNATVTSGMKMRNCRIYSVALDATGVLADYNGTVQANCVRNVDFSLAAKLTTSFTATTGGTVTINTSGATGARISGARDLYQGTAANQPILTIAAGGNYLTFDGTNDFLKAAAFSLSQPETVYFVGQQVTWTSGDALYDGNGLGNGMAVAQNSLTPGLSLFAGTQINNLISPALGVNSIISAKFNGASSSLRLNRTAAASASVGVESGNGLTLGCVRNATGFANITASEVLIYGENHDEIAQQRMAREQMRQRRIAA